MNKHWVLALLALSLLSACKRPTELAVQALSGVEGEEAMPLPSQVIRLLPYDRDSIFEALAAQAPEPEPQPPAALLELRDSLAVARARWTEAETAWNELRSELEELTKRMEKMDRASDEYFAAFRKWDELDAQVRRLDRVQKRYFDQFTELQGVYRALADSFNAVVTAWEEVAFEDFVSIVDSLMEDRQELVDTTNASGWAYFRVPQGRWWIHTRAKLVFEELYWNLLYQSAGGADTVILNRANAEIRPIF
jgi:uncharacterized protein YukE